MTDNVSPTNPKKLFVGNLPYSTREEELQSLFSQYGELVEVKLIVDRMSGRSRGIAFVEFVNEEDATKAIEGLNGYDMEGRALMVNVARPQAPRDNSFRPRFGGGGNDRRGGGGGYGGNRGGNGGGYGNSRGGDRFDRKPRNDYGDAS